MRVCLALTVVAIVFGRVLSAQFLLWLPPFRLPIGRLRWVAGACLLAALLLTRVVTDDYFSYALRFESQPVWLLALRDMALLALLTAAVVALRGERNAPQLRLSPAARSASSRRAQFSTRQASPSRTRSTA